MLPLYEDPCFTFRFADDRIIPRFHLEGVEVGRRVSFFKIDAGTCERLGYLATATVGEGGWVELTEPIIVRAGEAFIAVPEPAAPVSSTPLAARCVRRRNSDMSLKINRDAAESAVARLRGGDVHYRRCSFQGVCPFSPSSPSNCKTSARYEDRFFRIMPTKVSELYGSCRINGVGLRTKQRLKKGPDTMKKIGLMLLCLMAGASGCMEAQIRDRTAKLTTTTNDLFYMQVLDNVARTIDSPAEMPFFDMPSAGTVQIQQQLSATYTPQWGFSATAGAFAVGHWLFNQQQLAINPQQIESEAWAVAPTPDPDRLVLMHCAYLKITGHENPESEAVLHEYYGARDAWVDIAVQQAFYFYCVP